MNEKLLKKIYVILTIAIFISTSLSQSQSTTIDYITTDDTDGFWQINRFESTQLENNNWEIDQNISVRNGKITLEQSTDDEGIIYDMKQDDHAFYYFDFISFFQFLFPMVYTLFSPSDYNMMKKYVYPRIRNPDDVFFENAETDKPRHQVHLFKFKINEDVDSITKINVSWLGKSNNDNSIKLYYWSPYSETYSHIFGLWNLAAETTSNNQTIWLNWTFQDEDIPIADGYIYLAFVAVPIFEQTCNIATDYMKVTVFSKDAGTYRNSGTIISEEITKPNENATWENLIWEQKVQSNARIRYQLLYKNQTGEFIPVENEYLSKNEQHISTSQTGAVHHSLRKLPINYTSLKIKAILLASSNYLSAPSISSWGITWQNNQTIWKDSFNSTDPPLRVDTALSDMVAFRDGKAAINPIFYSWPLIGYDQENSRATDALPPEDSDVEWLYTNIYSDYDRVGGSNQHALLGEYLYIPTSEGRYIYQFNRLEDDPLNPQEPQLKVTIPDNLVVENTPAIGYLDEDELIIVATGNDHSNPVNEKWENKVFAFKDFNDMDVPIANEIEPLWELESEEINNDLKNICYQSSPVISEDMIYLTSCSGYQIDSPLFNRNNKIIALDLATGEIEWKEDLAAGSYCNPAIINNVVIVGCNNNNGPSVYAFNKNEGGEPEWAANAGAIGRASPLIYDDMAIVITKTGLTKLKVVALDILDNGNELWHHNISVLSIPPIGDLSPAIHDNNLYIATEDGRLHKLIISRTNKTLSWSKNFAPFTTAPTFADGNIYIGSSSGIYAIDGGTGETLWTSDSVSVESNPAIVDGFLYCSYSGNIMCIGDSNWDTELEGYITSRPIYLPSPSDIYRWKTFSATTSSAIGGDIRFKVIYNNKQRGIDDGDDLDFLNDENSIPQYIKLKAEFTSQSSSSIIDLFEWSVSFIQNDTSIPQFDDFTIVSENPLICRINVSDANGLVNSSAKYKLRYENNTLENIIVDYINITTDFPTNSTDVETLEVNLSALDFLKDNVSDTKISDNISGLEIRFSIENVNGTISESEWKQLLETKDKSQPLFFLDSFVGQISHIDQFPILSIQVQDDLSSDNITGLNTSSARFRIEFNTSSDTNLQSIWYNATCEGELGTQSKVLIRADLDILDDKENITGIGSIQFSIMDMAGNENQTDFLSISNDSTAPTSFINNKEDIDEFVNESSVEIIVNASDIGSGIKDVGLYSQKTGQENWVLFRPKKTQEPYEWDFQIGSTAGGEYSLRSIATDNASNTEVKEEGEVTFIFDPNKPTLSTFPSTRIFTSEDYNETEVPVFSDITFQDDYKLESVSYRMNFEATNEWAMINTEPIDSASYQPSWSITQEQWDIMEEDITYSIYFRLEDSLGNINIATTSNQALKIRKDFINDTPDTPLISPDITDFDNWKWDNEYKIEVETNTTEFQSIILYYAFSEKNTSNVTFEVYNESFDNESKSWMFKPTKGNGYYSFKIEMIDNQGSIITSDIKTVYIEQFPLVELMVIIVLAVALFIVTIIFYQKKRKTTV